MFPDIAQKLSSRCRPRSLPNLNWRFLSPTTGGVAKSCGDATRSWASSLLDITYVGPMRPRAALLGVIQNHLNRTPKAKSLLARHAVAPRSVARRKARTPSPREIWICRAVLTVTAFHLLTGRLRPARGHLGHGAKALSITGELVWPRPSNAWVRLARLGQSTHR
jgi:hypothetical protein